VLQQEKPVEMAAIGVDRTAWKKGGRTAQQDIGKNNLVHLAFCHSPYF